MDSEWALRERVKELTCLYGVARLAADVRLTLHQFLSGVVALLPPAWQYPEITTARITADELHVSTPGFRGGPHRQAADLVVAGARRGAVEVFYLEDRPAFFEGPFLKEERSLIDTVARQVEVVIDRTALQTNALTDALTGLANHRALRLRLAEEVERARRAGETFAVAMIDLDHFKPVNDRYGHLAGDAVLREAAQRLDAARREYDVLARYGGDEFVVILPRTTSADALRAAERLRAAISGSPFAVEGARLGATVGVAMFPDHPGADALLMAADKAMYAAKAMRKDER